MLVYLLGLHVFSITFKFGDKFAYLGEEGFVWQKFNYIEITETDICEKTTLDVIFVSTPVFNELTSQN